MKMLPPPPFSTRRRLGELTAEQVEARETIVKLLSISAVYALKRAQHQLGIEAHPEQVLTTGEYEGTWNRAITLMFKFGLSRYEVIDQRVGAYGLDLRPRRMPTEHGYFVLCNRCEDRKHEELFYKKVDMKDGLSSWCISCHDLDKATRHGGESSGRVHDELTTGIISVLFGGDGYDYSIDDVV